MTTKQRRTIRAVWLGQELKKLRQEADLTVQAMARYMKVDKGIISRMENARSLVDIEDVDKYLRICGIDAPKRSQDLHTICHDVRRKGWWEGYATDVASSLMDRIWLESKAIAISSFAPIVIPGLLQTPGYARAVMKAHQPDAASGDLDRWLEVRMNRQLVITRHDPIAFQAVIDESVIRRVSAEAKEVASVQLAYLAEALDHSHIKVRILPERAGLHASPSGGFEVHELEDPYPRAGLLATAQGDLCVEDNDVEQLALTYDRLRDASLSHEATKNFIIAAKEKL